jgi:hypothetical protein
VSESEIECVLNHLDKNKKKETSRFSKNKNKITIAMHSIAYRRKMMAHNWLIRHTNLNISKMTNFVSGKVNARTSRMNV